MAVQFCPIVGIGASAGGLEALKSLFNSLPANTGAAFVVIQHLDPKHESLTAEILTRFTAMPAAQVTTGMQVEPDHVYVIAPNTYLTMDGHTLEPGKPVLRHGLRMPIDTFLTSLAEQHQERAVAIIVSGTGSDGTLGLRAIKGSGGLVLAQSPETAQYEGMPRSAIATGLVDIVCPVEQMPQHITGYLQHPYVTSAAGTHEPAAATEARALGQIMAILDTRIGHDFRAYKPGTLRRRIARRMGLHQIKTLPEYVSLLRSQKDEPKKLFQDLLISVTSFFRDPEAFDALEEEVLAPLLHQKPTDEPIRVWVPGCATGEEAYSIAILLREHLDKASKHCPLQVFASDIDEVTLSVARTGLYPENVIASLSPARVKRFFSKEDHSYRVTKTLRETVTFAIQNVITDPPFSKLDLICCRNLLIYLNPDVQQKIFAVFHFALRDGGYLFLGHSETASQEGLFAPLSKKWRLYRRTNTAHPPPVEARRTPLAPPTITPVRPPAMRRDHLHEIAQRHLLQEFAPAAVVVDGKQRILHFSGPTGRYLELPVGSPTQDLLTLARHELRPKLRVALRRAAAEGHGVEITDAHVVRDGVRIPVRITLKPLAVPGSSALPYVITFEDQPAPKGQKPKAPVRSRSGAEATLLQEMEAELMMTREDLQNNIEEMESANEELQAANEEVMSVNEELQSSNEELESSKEELQSMNEELTTVNGQLKDKVEELARSHDDMANLLSSTDIATLFVDTDLRIKRFTNAATRLISLLPSDVGRPLNDIRPRISDSTLLDDARRVVDQLGVAECELTGEAGECYLRRIAPYRTADNRIAGAVITYIDISSRKRAESNAQRLAAVVRDSNDAITVQDLDGQIIAWNRGAERLYGWSEDEALGMNTRNLVPEGQRETATALIQRVAGGEAVHSLEIRRLCKDGREVEVWLTATPVVDPTQHITAIATTERDITERMQARAALREGEAKFRALLESAPDALVIVNAAGLVEVSNTEAQRLFGYTKDELNGMAVEQLMPERLRSRHVTHRQHYVSEGPTLREMASGQELCARTKQGVEVPIEVSLSPGQSKDGPIVTAAIRDITGRKLIVDELRKAKAVAESAVATKARFLATASHDLRQPLQSLSLLNAALVRSTTEAATLQMLTMQGEALASMSRLLDGLLDITRLESGTVVVMKKSLAVQSVFQSLLATFDAKARDKGLTLTFEPTDAIVHTDRNLLAQVLQNLTANAIRYTQHGFVRIWCAQEGNSWRIAVADSGIGIPADQLGPIFDEFHQLNRDSQERHAGLGLGLGLAIVQRVATLLETRIDVVSTVGQGSTFSILLPAGQMEPVAHYPAKVTEDQSAGAGGVILLIDDDPGVLAATRLVLSLEPGFRVTAAASPPEAYLALEHLTPDLIITDLHLNHRDSGIDIIRTARKRVGRPIPAILATGDTGTALGNLNLVDVATVRKPVDADKLILLARQLLEPKPPA